MLLHKENEPKKPNTNNLHLYGIEYFFRILWKLFYSTNQFDFKRYLDFGQVVPGVWFGFITYKSLLVI